MTNLNIILTILDWLKIGGFFLLNQNTQGIEWLMNSCFLAQLFNFCFPTNLDFGP